jgi:hypothetical protein
MIDLPSFRRHIRLGSYRLSLHAQTELVEDGFTVSDLEAGLLGGEVIEDYPDAVRGPCCLLNGVALDGRPIHIVVSYSGEIFVVITVYEPTPPKWNHPTERGPRP